MRKILRVLAKIMAFIFAVLFVIVTVAVLLLFNVERYLLNAEVYKRALARAEIYDRFPSLIAEQLTYQMQYSGTREEGEGSDPGDEENGPSVQFKYLKPKDYEVILRDLLPPDWLQTQTESALDQTFEFIASDAPTATIKISLVEVKARLGGQVGVDAALRLIRSWPPCTTLDLFAWAVVSSSGKLDDIPTCRPPDEVLDAFEPAIKLVLSKQVAKMPDVADLTQTFKDNEQDESEDNSLSGSSDRPPNVRRILRIALPLIRWSPLFSALLLFLVTLFGVRSLKGWLNWWGIPFLLVGLITGIPAVLVLLGLNPILTNFMANRIPAAMSPEVFKVGMDLMRGILRETIQWIAIEAGIIGLIGLMMIVVSVLRLPRRRETDKRAES
jgi:hypothetical protein